MEYTIFYILLFLLISSFILIKNYNKDILFLILSLSIITFSFFIFLFQYKTYVIAFIFAIWQIIFTFILTIKSNYKYLSLFLQLFNILNLFLFF